MSSSSHLGFHVSFLRTIDTYERSPVSLTYVVPNPPPPPPSPERIALRKDPFALTFRNRGFVRILDFFPTLPSARIEDFTHSDADRLFAEKPIFPLHSGACAVSDATAAVLQRFNIGRSDLVWLDPLLDDDPTIFRGAWTLWPAERYPTLFIPRWIHGEEPPFLKKIHAFSYNPSNIAVTGGQYTIAWYDRDTIAYLLPCRQPDTDVDLWVDPLWPQSLFLSNRLVEALDAEGLLMGTKDGWRTRPCRAPLPEEVAEDQVQPWIRAITDREWETMDEKTFRYLGHRAASEASGRAATASLKTLASKHTHLCVANVLLSHYDERNMEAVFTHDTVPIHLELRKRTIKWMEAISDDLELYILHLAIPLDHPTIQDLTPNLKIGDLPMHGSHIKIAWKTSNPAVYTDAVLKGLTQTLIDAATREYDTVGVHWG